MQPFFMSTRASMSSCPTTNCRCNRGLSSSKGMDFQGMYCRAAEADACRISVRFAREGGLAPFALAGGCDFDLTVFFAITLIQSEMQRTEQITGLFSGLCLHTTSRHCRASNRGLVQARAIR